MEFDIVTFGDLVTDILMPIPRLPVLANDIQLTHQMSIEPGGACNFLIMAQRLGLKTAALGCVGDDYYGTVLIEKLQGEAVDTSSIKVLVGQKTTAVILLIDDAGEHAFLGAMGTFQVTKIETAFIERINQSRALFTNGYAFLESSPPEMVIDMMKLARQKNKMVFFDPGPQIQQVSSSLMELAISQSDYLFLTYEEASALVSGGSAEMIAQNLLKLGPKMVALKMGSNGSLVACSQTSIRNAALAVPVRDTTGAGDAFDAAFVYGIMQDMPLDQICKLANTAGSVTVSRAGAGTRLPQRAEIEHSL